MLLLIPCLGIPFQDQSSLEQLHNRKLRPWPNTTQLISDPAGFFRHSREWLSDRAFPIKEAMLFQKKFPFYVLDTPPQRRVTIGENGFIFLNGASDDALNGILEFTCIRAHTEDAASALKRALIPLAKYAEPRGSCGCRARSNPGHLVR